MTKEEIEVIIEEYLKNNLRVKVETKTLDYYSKQRDNIEVSLNIKEELISFSDDSL